MKSNFDLLGLLSVFRNAQSRPLWHNFKLRNQTAKYLNVAKCGKHEYLNDQNKCVHKNDAWMKDPPEKSDALDLLSSIFG